MDRNPGLELSDPTARGDQLGVLRAGRAGELAGVDQVLAASDIDYLLADIQIDGDLGDPTADLDQIEHLATGTRADTSSARRLVILSGDRRTVIIQQADSSQAGAHMLSGRAGAVQIDLRAWHGAWHEHPDTRDLQRHICRTTGTQEPR